MKSIGITRKVDELGRIVIPIETRRLLGINEGDSLQIFIDNDKIILKKYQPGCIICNNCDPDNLIAHRYLPHVNPVRVCKDCINRLAHEECGN